MKNTLQVVFAVAKDLSVVLLLDYYGGLLNEKQRNLVEYYYCDDLSLAEISDNEGISRQGARDSIVRAVEKLKSYESALGFIKRSEDSKALLRKYRESGDESYLEELLRSIEEM